MSSVKRYTLILISITAMVTAVLACIFTIPGITQGTN